MSTESQLIKIAQAEDTYDLLNHIAWTDVLKPRLLQKKETFSKILVDHLLGQPLPVGLTQEQIAGKIYGINEIISTIEATLREGEKALENMKTLGISLQ
jgi:hypothetical protein